MEENNADENENVALHYKTEVVGFWKKASFLSGLGFELDIVVSYIISIFIIFSLMMIDHSATHYSIEGYFYVLNAIPAVLALFMSYSHISLPLIKEALPLATTDYIIIKTLFKLMEEMSFALISCCICGAIVGSECLKGESKINRFFICGFVLQLIAVSTNLQQVMIIMVLFLTLCSNKYCTSKSLEFHHTRIFIASLMYFLDLGMGMSFVRKAYENMHSFLKLVFYTYTAGFILSLVLYEYINQFSWAYSIMNVIFIIGSYVYNRSIENKYNALQEFIMKMSCVLSLSLLCLTKICSKTKIVKAFPPKNQNLYDFTTCSIYSFISKTTYDNKIIRVNEKYLLPRSTTNEIVSIRIIDFKLISILHILNEIVRRKQEKIYLDDNEVVREINNFSFSYYQALELAKEHYDELDIAIETTINNVVDRNNDIISLILYFIGFSDVGFTFFYQTNTYMHERNKVYARKIQESINKAEVGNIVIFYPAREDQDEE
ncbi:hypothetical protein NUSPORA_01019 [Nucleospora cyclopteri]